jgi:hypothetical protein
MGRVDDAIPPHGKLQDAAKAASTFHFLVDQHEGQQRAR